MKKCEIKKIGMKALEDSRKETPIPIQLLHIMIDLTTAKLDNKDKKKPRAQLKKKIEHAFVIRYTNHWIEKLNISALLHKQEL